MSTGRRSPWVLAAAACTAGAGLVHAAAAGTHGDEPSLVRLFAATALVQGALAAALTLSASRRLLAGAVIANAAAIVAWALSRATGLPVIDALAGREPVGTQDLAAAALAAGAVVAGVLALVLTAAPAATGRAAAPWVPATSVALAAVPALLGVTAPHEHAVDHDHDPGVEVAADHDHDTTHAGTVTLAVDPRLAGADTTHATEAQLTAALDLLDATRAGASTRLTTTAAAEAAGYVWIGDGRRPGGFQHYVGPELLADGRTLDPDAVESLVFENTDAGPVLVSAMYLLEPGSTMDDVPDVAGDLTTWHDHQNLCWDDAGTRLAGVLVDGRCRPGGTFRGTVPMLHVWLTDHPCGPFAGIEGHGAGCVHEH